MKVLLTGASGFVGGAILKAAQQSGLEIRSVWRSLASVGRNSEVALVTEIDGNTEWYPRLYQVDVVIHAAARAHVLRDRGLQSLAEYRTVNVQGTLKLARQAAAMGVKRFVFLSSVKVNGERTDGFLPSLTGNSSADSNRGLWSPSVAHGDGIEFTVNDTPAPQDAYGISKAEAEQGLWEIASQTGMEVVVIRPPLVYGPGVKGNFARLVALVRSGVPLPLASVNNRRSFIGLDNLVDLLIRCVDHPKAAGKTFLVSDGQDLSTPQLLRIIANSMGRPVRLFPLPVPLLRLAGRAMGRLNEVDRLVGSLQVDSSATRELLDWTPPVSVEEGMKRMVTGTQRA